jgi:putative transposase
LSTRVAPNRAPDPVLAPDGIAAADFFSVEVLTLTGLVRYLVLFVIDLQTRRVQIGGVVRQAYGAWMVQVARNLTDGVDGFLIGKRYLIHDRDPLFTDEFRGVLAAAGVKCLRLPARSSDLNSIAERFVLSIKSECLSKLVPLGESHLRRAVSEYVAHYHLERNHQGLDNRLITTVGWRPTRTPIPLRRLRLANVSAAS